MSYYSAKDLSIVRDLSKRYMEIACSDKHIRMRRRFRDTNDLKIVRPPVLIDEIPWHEMNYEGALDCVCENDELRGYEYGLRIALYREKYFKCDNLEINIGINKVFILFNRDIKFNLKSHGSFATLFKDFGIILFDNLFCVFFFTRKG